MNSRRKLNFSCGSFEPHSFDGVQLELLQQLVLDRLIVGTHQIGHAPAEEFLAGEQMVLDWN